jgi:hypothetical protein
VNATSVKARRLVVGQVTICRVCCCLNTEPGLPEVPVEWLKNEMANAGPCEARRANHRGLSGLSGLRGNLTGAELPPLSRKILLPSVQSCRVGLDGKEYDA